MAQLGSALDWGSRGRGFKSRQPDEKPGITRKVVPGFVVHAGGRTDMDVRWDTGTWTHEPAEVRREGRTCWLPPSRARMLGGPPRTASSMPRSTVCWRPLSTARPLRSSTPRLSRSSSTRLACSSTARPHAGSRLPRSTPTACSALAPSSPTAALTGLWPRCRSGSVSASVSVPADDAVTIRGGVVGQPLRLLRVFPLERADDVAAGPLVCAPTRAGLTVRFHSWRVNDADTSLHPDS